MVKSPAKADEEKLRVGENVSSYLSHHSISLEVFLEEVNLWKSSYDVLSEQLKVHSGQLTDKFTQEMIPNLKKFLKEQDDRRGFYSDAMKSPVISSTGQ